MIRLPLLNCFLLFITAAQAGNITVKNIGELNTANKNAQPGDMIVLQNGEWKNVTIKLNCSGTKEQPITFKAQTAGKVLITGNSQLRLGGNYIVVDGLYFTNGYSGNNPVISFRIDAKQLANNCRVTNTVIDDFNNPKRMDDNNWVLFYGKNNRLDHCSFRDKKNMGVLLAVILDDERSRHNFHSIDHNYFGRRPPLASNGGEIIRVGVSQHAQFNSTTSIVNNFFEECDGETEIISIKSALNRVNENIFKECQGSVVLRHGDDNVVVDNYFIGNNKPGTGGVRVINRGHQVVANVFYKCRGLDFRSPLAIMNGIPNSPAHRYVQVTGADIRDNIFFECAPVTFGEGSDAERTLPPDNVSFTNNIFYNTGDSIIYKIYDDTKGIRFKENKAGRQLKQTLLPGFEKSNLSKQKIISGIPLIEKKTYEASGATWFEKKPAKIVINPLVVACATAADIYRQLARKEPVAIQLTKSDYTLNKPFVINKPVLFKGTGNKPVTITAENMLAVFVLAGNGNLSLQNITIDGKKIKATHFISSDSSGSSSHYNLAVNNCSLQNIDRANGCQSFFYAYKSMIADSIVITNSNFSNNNVNTIILNEEKEDKGYYNAEKIIIRNNNFSNQTGVLLNIYRGGNDESTLGPQLTFMQNNISSCNTADSIPLIHLTGVQVSNILSNRITDCNANGILIRYTDTTRARHYFEGNVVSGSGSVGK